MANKSQEEIYNAAANRAVTRSLRTGQNGGTPVTSEKKIADGILEFFSSTGPLQTALGGIQSSVQQFGGVVNGTSTGSMDTRTYRALKYQYANMYVKAALGEAATNIDRAGDNTLATIDRASESLVKTFKPVSSFVGSTLYTLTGMMKDPIGSIGALPNTVGSIMDKMNPGFSQTITSTWQKNNIQKLAEMPGQLFGNIQQMVKTIDGVLAVPIGFFGSSCSFY